MTETGEQNNLSHKKSSKLKWMLIIFFSLVLLSAIIFASWFHQQVNKIYQQPILPKNQTTHYILKPGQSLGDVSAFLVAKGYLTQPKLFLYMAKYYGLNTKIKAGEYNLKPNSSAWDILLQLVKGHVIVHEIRFIEGWRFQQLLDLLQKTKGIKHVLVYSTPAGVMQQLGLGNQNPEGEFFPSTYQYVFGTTDKQILLTSYQTMQTALNTAWKTRAKNLPYKNPYQALIVASLIEKETSVASERSLIAGVIIKRLQKNMYLQVDPTVIYGLGNAYDGFITKTQLQQLTPYNTYRIKGLPPTPIALPGLASIQAALQPKITDALYYVATGFGGHYFSATLAQHDAEIKKYIAYQASQLSKQTLPLEKPVNLCNQMRVPTNMQYLCQPCWYFPESLAFICRPEHDE